MPNSVIDIFLKLDGIEGESAVSGHEKEIDVLSYEQALDVAVVVSGGGGGAGAGRSTFSGVRFRKNVDTASVPMALASAAGQHIKDARFTFRRGASAFEFYQIALEDLLITHLADRAGTGTQYPLSFDVLNAGAAAGGLIEEATLHFSRIRWEYRTQRPDGSVGNTIAGGWDVRANRKL